MTTISKEFHAFWDLILDTGKGCVPVDETCRGCFAAQAAGTLHQQAGRDREVRELYKNTTNRTADGRYVFNGNITNLSFSHSNWTLPLRWPGAKNPIMGPGKPSLIFTGCETDLFVEGRPDWVIDQTLDVLTRSKHIGQVLSKRSLRVRDYFSAQAARLGPEAAERWKRHLWIGFSGGTQALFDERWAPMRELAQAGFTIFASIAPMLEEVTLPDDFLALGDRGWVIVSGEQGRHDRCRPMKEEWVLKVLDQCRAAGVPSFVKQMSARAPIPPDWRIARAFPRVRI